MRFLADESCDRAVVVALRAAGHDVRAVGETQQRSDDSVLAEESCAEGRVLLTEDLDFGHLVFAQGTRTAGVVLIRWDVTARSGLAARMVELAAQRGPDLSVSFVVMEPGRTRFRRVPHP